MKIQNNYFIYNNYTIVHFTFRTLSDHLVKRTENNNELYDFYNFYGNQKIKPLTF